MKYFFLRTALIGSLFITIGSCKAGDYDLPACGDIEICGNKLDDDCDGIKDNPAICECTNVGEYRDCPLRVGLVTKRTNPASLCTEETQYCRADRQWSDCSGGDPIPEQCGNSVDDDCDGSVDANDPEGCATCVDGQTKSIVTAGLSYRPESICKIGIQECKNGIWTFQTGKAAVGPKPSDANCDNFDDDCDGQVNEDAIWQSGATPFALGKPCWDTGKTGACRTIGTVVCNAAGATTCDNQQSPRADYQKSPSTNSLVDSTNQNAVWDWNCDGRIEEIVCTGSSAVCVTSNVPKTIYMTIDHGIDCSSIKVLTCTDSVVVRATAGVGTSIQCGTPVSVSECELYNFGAACRDKVNPQSGFMYCR